MAEELLEKIRQLTPQELEEFKESDGTVGQYHCKYDS